MPVPTGENWKRLPGNFDTVNARRLFPSDNALGFPLLYATPMEEPASLTNWSDRRLGLEGKGIHFFTDDYRFEPLWNSPDRYEAQLRNASHVLTPDFSCYSDWPRSMQMWNIYRSRWLGALWQSWGLSVIPTVTWGCWRTFDFVFKGIERGSTVAISTSGASFLANRRSFEAGFLAMLEEIDPSLVLVYGEGWKKLGLDGLANTTHYAPEGILEMKRRIAAKMVDTRQLSIWERIDQWADGENQAEPQLELAAP